MLCILGRCVKQGSFTTIWHRFVESLWRTGVFTAASPTHIVVASIVWISNVNFIWSTLCRLLHQRSNVAVSLNFSAISIGFIISVSIRAVLASWALTTAAEITTVIDLVSRLMSKLSSILLLSTSVMLDVIDETVNDFLHRLQGLSSFFPCWAEIRIC